MSDLQNKFIDESYGSLLHTNSDTGITPGTLENIEDGNGLSTPLNLSDTEVNINGVLTHQPIVGGEVMSPGQSVYGVVRNNSGQNLLKGTPVKITGSSGQKVTIARRVAEISVPQSTDANDITAICAQDIPNNGDGVIIFFGGLNVNTGAFTDGDTLYVSTTGTLTNVAPSAPYETIPVGVVVRAHSVEGVLSVAYHQIVHLNDVTGVNLSSLTDGDVMKYDGATGTFINAPVSDLTTASNEGTGEGLFIQKTGDNLEFKSLTGSGATTITSTATEINILTDLTGYLQSGDNISLLTNDAGYLTTALQSGDNVSELNNDAGYITFATIPSNIMVEGENVSLLNNDAGYISSIPTTYLQSGDNVSELVNDNNYLEGASGLVSEGINIKNTDPLTAASINFDIGSIGIDAPLFVTSNNIQVNGSQIDIISGQFQDIYMKHPTWTPNDATRGNGGQYLNFTDASGTGFNGYIGLNRYGQMQFINPQANFASGQRFVFQGATAGSGEIYVGGFNTDNNSTNWKTSYDETITGMTTVGQDLVLSQRNGSSLQTTLPGGAGGGLIDINSSISTTVGTDQFVKTSRPIDGLIYTIGTDSFNTADVLYLTAISYNPGDILNKIAFEIKNYTTSGDALVGIYNSDGGVNEPGTLIGSSSITVTGIGYKFLENLNFSLPSNNTGVYWVALYIPGSNFRASQYTDTRTVNTVFNYPRLKVAPGYTGRLTYTISGSLSSLPSDLSTATFNKNNDKEPVIIYGY